MDILSAFFAITNVVLLIALLYLYKQNAKLRKDENRGQALKFDGETDSKKEGFETSPEQNDSILHRRRPQGYFTPQKSDFIEQNRLTEQQKRNLATSNSSESQLPEVIATAKPETVEPRTPKPSVIVKKTSNSSNQTDNERPTPEHLSTELQQSKLQVQPQSEAKLANSATRCENIPTAVVVGESNNRQETLAESTSQLPISNVSPPVPPPKPSHFSIIKPPDATQQPLNVPEAPKIVVEPFIPPSTAPSNNTGPKPEIAIAEIAKVVQFFEQNEASPTPPPKVAGGNVLRKRHSAAPLFEPKPSQKSTAVEPVTPSKVQAFKQVLKEVEETKVVSISKTSATPGVRPPAQPTPPQRNTSEDLFDAVENGKCDVVWQLLREHPPRFHSTEKDAALRLAAESNQLAMCKMLVDELAVDMKGQDEDGRTALYLAAMKGFEGIVEYFAWKGADLNHQTNNGMTALMAAAKFGRESVVRLLMAKGADANLQTRGCMTAYRLAKNEVIRNILSSGA